MKVFVVFSKFREVKLICETETLAAQIAAMNGGAPNCYYQEVSLPLSFSKGAFISAIPEPGEQQEVTVFHLPESLEEAIEMWGERAVKQKLEEMGFEKEED